MATLPFTLTFDLHGDGDTPMENAIEMVKAANVCLSDDTIIIREAIESSVNGFHQVTFEVDGKVTAFKLAAAYIGAPFNIYDPELRDVVRAALMI
jgi:hypothetical protein